MVGKSSAKAADGDFADYFRYGFVTGHRPENLTERQLVWLHSLHFRRGLPDA
jgi:hypothetical protein